MIKKAAILCLMSLGGFISNGIAETAGDLNQAKQQIFTLIQSGNYAGADSATNQLIASSPGDMNLADVVHQIALKYQGVKNYQKEIEVSKLVITNWPQSSDAGWAQMDIVIANLSLNDTSAVKTEVETLITKYKDNPDLPKMLFIIGQGYKSGEFSQILKQHFDANCPAKTQLAILNADIMAKIESGDYGTAVQTVDKMITESPTDTNLPYMLLAIAQQFSWHHQPDQAGNVYQKIVQQFPDSPLAPQAQKGISKMGQITNIISKLIDSGDYGNVSSAVGDLISQFGDEADTPASVYEIANKLEGVGQFGLARDVYGQIIWRYPQTAWGDMSKIGVQRTKFLAFEDIGDETSAESIFNSMLSDFKGNSFLPENILWSAEGCYRLARVASINGLKDKSKILFGKAVEILQLLVNTFPNSGSAPGAYYMLAICCAQELGDYQKGISYLQILVNTWPNFKYAQQAQLLIVEYRNKMNNNK